MTDPRDAALRLALEALEADDSKLWPSENRRAAIAAIDAALAAKAEPTNAEIDWVQQNGHIKAGDNTLHGAIDYWQEEARRYAGNADYWRGRYEAIAAKVEPVATLHDDGCFTWKRDEYRLKHDRQRAGWRMDVYTAPPQREPLTEDEHRALRQAARESPETMDTVWWLIYGRMVERKVRGES